MRKNPISFYISIHTAYTIGQINAELRIIICSTIEGILDDSVDDESHWNYALRKKCFLLKNHRKFLSKHSLLVVFSKKPIRKRWSYQFLPLQPSSTTKFPKLVNWKRNSYQNSWKLIFICVNTLFSTLEYFEHPIIFISTPQNTSIDSVSLNNSNVYTNYSSVFSEWIDAMSQSFSWKSNMLKFSTKWCFFIDFGMTRPPFWT